MAMVPMEHYTAKRLKMNDLRMMEETIPLNHIYDFNSKNALGLNDGIDFKITPPSTEGLGHKVDEAKLLYEEACTRFRGAKILCDDRYSETLVDMDVDKSLPYVFNEAAYQHILCTAPRGLRRYSEATREVLESQEVLAPGAIGVSHGRAFGWEKYENHKKYPTLRDALPYSVDANVPTQDSMSNINGTLIEAITTFPPTGF